MEPVKGTLASTAGADDDNTTNDDDGDLNSWISWDVEATAGFFLAPSGMRADGFDVDGT